MQQIFKMSYTLKPSYFGIKHSIIAVDVNPWWPFGCILSFYTCISHHQLYFLFALSRYTSEAPEMQMRRMADLAFMFQLYEIAYQTYHTAKRDFNNDHAWLYFAGALVSKVLNWHILTWTVHVLVNLRILILVDYEMPWC